MSILKMVAIALATMTLFVSENSYCASWQNEVIQGLGLNSWGNSFEGRTPDGEKCRLSIVNENYTKSYNTPGSSMIKFIASFAEDQNYTAGYNNGCVSTDVAENRKQNEIKLSFSCAKYTDKVTETKTTVTEVVITKYSDGIIRGLSFKKYSGAVQNAITGYQTCEYLRPYGSPEL